MLATFTASAQEKILVQRVQELYSALDNVDLEALPAQLCSKLTKDQVYNSLDAYFLNDQNKFRFVFTNLNFRTEAAKLIDGEKYQLITFRNVIRITYFTPIDVAAEKARLKARFNAQSIEYNKDRNAFLIVYNAKMVTSGEGENFRFTFVDNTLPTDISEGCISEKVKKELGI